MRRLILIVVILCVLFGVSITIARAIGFRQPPSPPSEIVQQLHMNDCEAPCFLGVTVGKTSYLEAILRIAYITIPGYGREVFLNRNTGDIEYRLIDKDFSDVVDLYIGFEHGKVSEVRVYLRGPTANLTLGDFIQQYGVPICMLAEPDFMMDRVPGMYAAVQINNTIIELRAVAPPRWDTQIRYMSIHTDDKRRRNLCTCSGGKALSRYTYMSDQLIIPHYIQDALLLAPCRDPN